jgi:hypothetical protein
MHKRSGFWGYINIATDDALELERLVPGILGSTRQKRVHVFLLVVGII